MSGSSTPRSATAPKSLSDRVLNLKFMQRASAASSPATPSQTQVSFRSSQTRPSPYSAQDLPSAKRQRLDIESPISPDTSIVSHQTPASADRSTFLREGLETEWVLNLAPVGSSQINSSTDGQTSDDEDEPVWSNKSTGRQIYGAFHRKKTTITAVNGASTSTSTPTAQTPATHTTFTSESSPDSGSESGEVSDSPSSPAPPVPDRQNNKAHRLVSQTRRKVSKLSEDADLSRLSTLSGSYHVNPNSQSMANFAGLRGPPSGRRGGGGGRSKFEKAFANRGGSNGGNANGPGPRKNKKKMKS